MNDWLGPNESVEGDVATPRSADGWKARLKWASALTVVVGVTSSLIAVSLTVGKMNCFSWNYLFGDHGVTMWAAEEILAGGVLYRDVSMPYGPAPIYLYAGVAALFGNHIAAYLYFHAGFSLLFVILAYVSLSRFYRPWTAAAAVLLVLAPLAGAPGTFMESISAAYVTPEKCLLAGLTLLWSIPSRRTIRQGAALGLMFGGWQFVKFGGGVFAGGAILLLDVLYLALGRSERQAWWTWVRAGLGTVAAVLMCEAVRAIGLFILLPANIAWDVIWPAYTKAFYDDIPVAMKHPAWYGIRYFIVRQLPLLAGAAISALSACSILRNLRTRSSVDRRQDTEPSVLLPGLFFLLGFLGYFGHIFSVMQYAWCLGWAVASILAQAPWWMRLVLLAPFAPLLLITLRMAVWPAIPADMAEVPLPNGEIIYGRGGARDHRRREARG